MGTVSWLVLGAIMFYLVYTTYKRYSLLKNYNPEDESDKLLILDDKQFKTSIAKGVTLVDFWAPWCAPCRMIAPIVSDLAEEFDGQAQVAKINIDENKTIAATYGIRSIPTLIIFKDGKPAKQISGIKPKSILSKAIREQL